MGFRRKHHFLRGLIIFLIVVVVLPVSLVFIFLYDTKTYEPHYDENFTTEKMVDKMLNDSLDYTVSEKIATIRITEDDINNIIHSSLGSNEDLTNYLQQVYFDIDENKYVLFASGKLSFFATTAKITVTCSEETVVSDEGSKDAYILSITGINIARVPNLKSLLFMLLTKFINDETLESLLGDLPIHSDLANGRMFIYKDDVFALLDKYIGKEEGGMYLALLNSFLSKGLIGIDFYTDESLSINIDLSLLEGNDFSDEEENVFYPINYSSTSTNLKINGEDQKLSFDTIATALATLLDEDVISKDDLSEVSNYLIKGHSSGEPSFDLSSIGINDKTTYEGFSDILPASSMDSMLTEGVGDFTGYSIDQDQFDLFTINEQTINSFIQSQNLVGNKFFLSREKDDGSHKVSYVAIDNVYINFMESKAALVIGLNLNGLETYITLEMNVDTSSLESSTLAFDIKNLYFGNKEQGIGLNEEMVGYVFDYLDAEIISESFSFSHGRLSLSFDSLIASAISSVNSGNPIYDAAYQAFLSTAKFGIRLNGDKASDNSTLTVFATRNI